MRVYQPLSYEVVLKPHPWTTEFEIQAELYTRLKTDGFKVNGESGYRAKGTILNDGCRFDLVVFDKKGKGLAIIEVKSKKVGKQKSLDTMQGVKYRRFGVPVVQFYDMDEYDSLLKVLNGRAEEVESDPDGDKPSMRYVRYTTLYRRLFWTQNAAFDAKTETKDAVEKHMMQDIEAILATQIERMETIKNIAFNDNIDRELDRPEK